MARSLRSALRQLNRGLIACRMKRNCQAAPLTASLYSVFHNRIELIALAMSASRHAISALDRHGCGSSGVPRLASHLPQRLWPVVAEIQHSVKTDAVGRRRSGGRKRKPVPRRLLTSLEVSSLSGPLNALARPSGILALVNPARSAVSADDAAAPANHAAPEFGHRHSIGAMNIYC